MKLLLLHAFPLDETMWAPQKAALTDHDVVAPHLYGRGSSVDAWAGSLLDELVRDGARQMLAAALQAEVAAYVEAHRGVIDDEGRRLVVRNGFHGPREVTTAAGAVPVRQPRVNDKRTDVVTGQRRRFSSEILPAWSRKSPRVAEVLPLLYLHGLSSSDFVPALEGFFGSAAGLSASVVTRLTAQWQAEREAFMARSLADRDYVYIWADGVHFNVRLAEERLLLAAFRRFLTGVATGPGRLRTDLPARLLDSPVLRCKANLLTRLHGLDELVGPVETQSVYVTLANPLHG